MDSNYLKRIYWHITGVLMLVVVVALASSSYLAHRAFERELVPEVAKKAATVGASARSLILKAVGYGIEFQSLYGVEQEFADLFDDNPEFSYLGATDTRGNILFQGGKQPEGAGAYFRSPAVLAAMARREKASDATLVGTQYVVSLPIVAESGALGMLHIGVERRFVDHIMFEVLLDVAVVLVVALFFTVELLNFMAGARLESRLRALADVLEAVRRGDFTVRARVATEDEIGRVLKRIDSLLVRLNKRHRALADELQAKLRAAPPGQHESMRDAVDAWGALRARFRFGPGVARTEGENGLNRIRAPLFTFIVAEELTRSFLPAYVNELLVPIPGLSPQIVIGLPIVLFMLIVAIGQPYLGSWSERIGRRRAMTTGAILATIGFAATALAYNVFDLLLWRSFCALGYGMVFVAAQGYVLDHSLPKSRAQGFALFIGAIMVATVCGPSIGGILADNIGYRLSFGIAAALAGLSILTMRMLPADRSGADDTRTSRRPTLREIVALIGNRRFITLTGLAAMPAKIALTSFCFYLIPLYIVSIGSTQAMAGRMLMVYAVMMVLIVPIVATFSDVGLRRERWVATGLCLSGLGGFFLLASGSFMVVFVVVFLLGLGQALSIAPQSALVGEHCREEIERYGSDAVYGVYRLLERLGNALGPLAASVLVVIYGYQGAFVAISVLMLFCGILFALMTRGYHHADLVAAE